MLDIKIDLNGIMVSRRGYNASSHSSVLNKELEMQGGDRLVRRSIRANSL
jgi:hypothetical protein